MTIKYFSKSRHANVGTYGYNTNAVQIDIFVWKFFKIK